MLDEFKDSQFIACSLLNNAIVNNKLSHAYLIDTNNCDRAFDFVLSFVKAIVCNKDYNEFTNFDYNICNRIDNNNYTELKIIEAESSVIKKEQLLELQSDFSRSSIEGQYRIYIIKDCDKMNKQAANCLLKFLEEPVDNIIAILMTNKFNKLLSTIISRCQVIRLNNNVELGNKSSLENFAAVCCNNKDNFYAFVNDEKKKELLSSIIYFLDYFEENGLDTLIYIKNLWYNKFVSREDASLALLLMVYFYYDMLKFKLGTDKYFFCDKIDFINKCASYNSLSSILKKIEIVTYAYDMIACNLNVNLLLDDIIIRLGDVSECS